MKIFIQNLIKSIQAWMSKNPSSSVLLTSDFFNEYIDQYPISKIHNIPLEVIHQALLNRKVKEPLILVVLIAKLTNAQDNIFSIEALSSIRWGDCYWLPSLGWVTREVILKHLNEKIPEISPQFLMKNSSNQGQSPKALSLNDLSVKNVEFEQDWDLSLMNKAKIYLDGELSSCMPNWHQSFRDWMDAKDLRQSLQKNLVQSFQSPPSNVITLPLSPNSNPVLNINPLQEIHPTRAARKRL